MVSQLKFTLNINKLIHFVFSLNEISQRSTTFSRKSIEITNKYLDPRSFGDKVEIHFPDISSDATYSIPVVGESIEICYLGNNQTT